MTARKLANYPPEFAAAFRRAQQGERVALPCASHDEAVKLRMRLYHYRHALFADPDFDVQTALAASDLGFDIEGSTLTIFKK